MVICLRPWGAIVSIGLPKVKRSETFPAQPIYPYSESIFVCAAAQVATLSSAAQRIFQLPRVSHRAEQLARSGAA